VGHHSQRLHQRQGHAALLSGGHTPPSVMPIDSPHEPPSEGNDNSLGGALPQGLLATVSVWRHHLRATLQAHHSRMLLNACLFATPAREPHHGGDSAVVMRGASPHKTTSTLPASAAASDFTPQAHRAEAVCRGQGGFRPRGGFQAIPLGVPVSLP